MSELPSQPAPADDLQFTTAERAQPGDRAAETARVCFACQQPLGSSYYALGENLLCADCRERFVAPPPGNPVSRLAKATLFGLVAGLAGAAIWFAIRRFAHLEVGLVAILVGFMVGKAVRVGSAGRGGRGYQFLAVALTYGCIAANYMPDIFEGLVADHKERQAEEAEEAEEAAAAKPDPGEAVAAEGDKPPQDPPGPPTVGDYVTLLAFMFALALALPFLAGFENIIGILIIGFALWEAWKFNAYQPLPITGPYQLAAPATS